MKQETLGQVFKRYRLADNIKIEKVEKETRISKRMLLAIEEDDYSKLTDDLSVRHTIKAYAQYLLLDYNRLIVLYEQGRPLKSVEPIKEKNTKPIRVYITPRLIKIGFICLVVVCLLSYLGWQVNKIYQAPTLVVFYPDNDIIIQDNYLDIKGAVEKEAKVYINDKEVFPDKFGNFEATMDLQKGRNTIKISAVKKYSRANIIYREVLVQMPEPAVLP